MDQPAALYVHIPFCATKCPYCDFNTYAGIEPLMEPYLVALRTEIEIWGQLLAGPELQSIFFGGGTPSYLPVGSIDMLLDRVAAAFRLADGVEITLEANPDDLADEKLDSFMRAGINRLSLGVQSLDDGLLQVLGRRHSADDALGAYYAARQAGFGNVSIDLMYGLPGQTADQWGATLAATLAVEPSHISMYCLTLEGGTPMERGVAAGRLPQPDGDLAADMYLVAEAAAAAAGYRHYEISNWALPGMESRHNLAYWRNRPFLGVGPGAHSYIRGRRFHNLKSPREYIRRLDSRVRGNDVSRAGGVRRNKGLVSNPSLRDNGDWLDRVPVVEGVEAVDRRLEMAETMMMGLRIDTGIDSACFAARFGSPPAETYGAVISALADDGLLDVGGKAIRLTARGRLLGNEVFSRFF